MAKVHLATDNIAEVAKDLSEATKLKINEGCEGIENSRLKEIKQNADLNYTVADKTYQEIDDEKDQESGIHM